MKWRWLALIGCGGLLVVCGVLPFSPYFWRMSQASLARQRWERIGLDDYTIVVTHYCFCRIAGEYKLTIQDGAVSDLELLGGGWPSGPPLTFADFSSLTVDAMLTKAENSARKSWDVPWSSTLRIDYDSTYGYVTHYTSDVNGWFALFAGRVTDSSYSYMARDLQVAEP